MFAHGARLPAGVREDGAIEHRPDLAVGGHQRQGGRLDARAQAEHAQSDPIAGWILAEGDKARRIVAGAGGGGGKRHRVSPRRAGRGRSLCLVSPSRRPGRALTLSGGVAGAAAPAEGVAGDRKGSRSGEGFPLSLLGHCSMFFICSTMQLCESRNGYERDDLRRGPREVENHGRHRGRAGGARGFRWALLDQRFGRHLDRAAYGEGDVCRFKVSEEGAGITRIQGDGANDVLRLDWRVE